MRQVRHYTVLLVAISLILGMAGTWAWSQETDTIRQLRSALVGPTNAYAVLPTEFVCANGQNRIYSSPDATDVLIQHSEARPINPLDKLLKGKEENEKDVLSRGGITTTQVLLVSKGDDHAQVVWRGSSSLQTGLTTLRQIVWLPGTRTALLRLTVQPGPLPANFFNEARRDAQFFNDDAAQRQTIVRINTATGKSQIIATGIKPFTQLIASLTAPFAVLVDIEADSVQRIAADGTMGAVVALSRPEGKAQGTFRDAWPPEGILTWGGFLSDGRTLSAMVIPPPGGNALPDWYYIDTLTGDITKSERAREPDARRVGNAEMPFSVAREKRTLVRDDATADVVSLWLEGREKETIGRVLIAADSDPESQPTLLQTAVLYKYKGAVYAVPIVKTPALAFLAQRRAVQKRETIERAQQIGVILMMYAATHENTLPPVGSDIVKLAAANENPAYFLNPETGQNGFKATYQSISTETNSGPEGIQLGYLTGPGGTAVIYRQGKITEVRWQDN